MIPAEFATEESAVKAAMNYIVRKRNPEAKGKWELVQQDAVPAAA